MTLLITQEAVQPKDATGEGTEKLQLHAITWKVLSIQQARIGYSMWEHSRWIHQNPPPVRCSEVVSRLYLNVLIWLDHLEKQKFTVTIKGVSQRKSSYQKSLLSNKCTDWNYPSFNMNIRQVRKGKKFCFVSCFHSENSYNSCPSLLTNVVPLDPTRPCSKVSWNSAVLCLLNWEVLKEATLLSHQNISEVFRYLCFAQFFILLLSLSGIFKMQTKINYTSPVQYPFHFFPREQQEKQAHLFWLHFLQI